MATEVDAFEEGVAAYESGLPLSANPYLSDPDINHEDSDWADGWREARREDDNDNDDDEDKPKRLTVLLTVSW